MNLHEEIWEQDERYENRALELTDKTLAWESVTRDPNSVLRGFCYMGEKHPTMSTAGALDYRTNLETLHFLQLKV